MSVQFSTKWFIFNQKIHRILAELEVISNTLQLSEDKTIKQIWTMFLGKQGSSIIHSLRISQHFYI